MKDNFQSQKFYDLVAPKYDEIVGQDSFADDLEPFLTPRASEIHRALDIGAGTGKTIDGVLAWVEPETIVAVDISAHMLLELKKKHARIDIYHGDVLEYLAGDPEPFDLITAFCVFQLLPDLDPVIVSLARKLNPGGLFVFIYEPIIAHHPTQSSAETMDWVLPEAPRSIYRRHPEHILTVLRRSGLRILEDRALPNAGQRSGEWIEERFVAARA
ncbi:MAG: class I SAM-dependent methyltransferase [Candidatus Tumulicola sp.]